jgi:predicted O-methyltransferase YrrM
MSDSGYLKYMSGMVDEDELLLIAKYCSEVPEGGTILDIGTADGKSALTMGLNSKPMVKVFTLDIEVGEKIYKHIDYMELNHKVFFIRSTSKILSRLWTTPLDFLFIDGSHNYEDVVSDIEVWLPHVKEGGYLGFHDYGNKAFGVTEAVDKFEGKLYKKVEDCSLVYIAQKI